ncbi:MAG: carbonic anhydrase [Haloarculaceae archaeon]
MDERATRLLERNADHVASLPEGYFDDVRDGQKPDVVSICCSDSRVSQAGMFEVSEPGELFTPSNIGNQVRDRVHDDGETRTVVDGSLLYPVVHTGTRTVAVVGHTQCGAVTAAYDHVTDGGSEPAGIQKLVDLLVPIVEDALDAGIVETAGRRGETIDRLVEYNVDSQVTFLGESDDLPADTSVYGFVYDFHGRYGGPEGRVYLVNAGGDRDVESLQGRVGAPVRNQVARLTSH